MGYPGRDGYWYDTIEEKNAADRRWEQNKLLKEQNKLLRDAEEQRKREKADEDHRREQRRLMEEAHQLWDAVGNKARQTYNQLDRDIEDIYPIFQEAGAKNPEAYVKKLEELYPCKMTEPQEITFPNLDLAEVEECNIQSLETSIKKVSSLQKTIQEMEKDEAAQIDDEHIQELGDLLSSISDEATLLFNKLTQVRAQKDSKIVLWLIPAIVLSIVLLVSFLNFFGDNLFAVPVIIIVDLVFFIAYKVSTRRYKQNKYIDEEELKKVNSLIKDYNIVVIESEELHKRKKGNEADLQKKRIHAYEKRRVENLNLPLEYALERLTEAYSKAFLALEQIENKYGVTLRLSNPPDFRLHDYSYPVEYKRYKKQLIEKNADDDGTSIFLGL